MDLLAALSAGTMFAQDITGTWQGALVLPNKQELRTVFKISKDASTLKGVMYSIDQTPQGFACEVTLAGDAVKISIPGIAGVYDGKLDSAGANLTGKFTQGNSAALPLNLKHLGPYDPAWPMPDAPAPPKAMTETDPEFDACSVKPSPAGQPGPGLTVRGREIVTVSTPVSFLITFVYGLSPKEVVGGPAWMYSDRFDLDGKPAAEGMPNQQQIKIMIQKLLADRFQLSSIARRGKCRPG